MEQKNARSTARKFAEERASFQSRSA